MRKRSKYRPKPVLVNPLGYVIESMTPVTRHDNFLIDLKIKNSEAMVSLMQGRAAKADMDILISMSNVTEALQQMGFGKEYQDVCVDGRFAILKIIDRAQQHGRFTPTGPEIQLLNLLMELHDAQMDVITVRDIEKAPALVKFKIQYDKDTIKLARVPEATS
jgi:hypothetical protein